MEPIEILVCYALRPKQLAALEREYQVHRLDLSEDSAALLAEIGPRIRAVVTSAGVGFRECVLAQLPNVELVASFGVGTDSLCLDACRARGVPVTNTPDVLTDDVADMAMMLMLATLRRLPAGERWIQQGRWVREGQIGLNRSLRGKRVGIAGLGRIGKAIAARAEPFGLEISYYGRRQQRDIAYPWYDDLVALAHEVDILMLALPGGDETRGIVDAKVLDALGPEGYLINIGRGSLVDEPVLVECLQRGALAGAGLDVFANEPHVPPALLELDSVVLQPHCASGTVETRGAMAQLVVDNLVAHFAGRPLLTPVF